MKRIVTVLLLMLCSLSGFAQFTINGADDYLRQKAEAVEKQRIQDSLQQVKLEEQQLMSTDIRYRIKWVNMITYRQSIGLMENTYNLSYYGYMVTKDEWTFPNYKTPESSEGLTANADADNLTNASQDSL